MIQESKYNCPIHNSLAPVNLLIKNNVNVGLGIDNIEDVFMPFCDGDLKFELRLLSESQRIYNPNILTNICNNDM